MSKMQTIRGQCPNCRLEQEVVLWDSVNVSLNPELKEKVLSLDLLRLRCSGCQGILMLGYPMVYHDMGRPLMISFNPGPSGEESAVPPFMNDYTLRCVRTPEQLAEKIVIFDHDLDDRAVECLKFGALAALLAGYADFLEKMQAMPLGPEQLLFCGTLETKGEPDESDLLFILLTPSPSAKAPAAVPSEMPFPLFLAVKRAVYREQVARLQANPAAALKLREWASVDFAWAQKILPDDEPIPEVRLIVSPVLETVNPFAKDILAKHRELMQLMWGAEAQ